MKKTQKKAAQGRTEPDRDKDRDDRGERERGTVCEGTVVPPIEFLVSGFYLTLCH